MKLSITSPLSWFLILIIIGILFIMLAPQFGQAAQNGSLKKIQNSPNFSDGKFRNLIPTTMMTASLSESIKDTGKFFLPSKDTSPQKTLPSKTFDKNFFEESNSDLAVTWLGHSSILMQTPHGNVLTDPVFSGAATPMPIGGKQFEYKNNYSVKDLPEIDYVVISHDHYDHLDYKTIKELNGTNITFLVPLGVGSHMQRWGIAKQNIIELDWYEGVNLNNIEFTAAPARHFSGRSVHDSGKTLWASWIIKTPEKNIYFSGDSGYFDEFKKIGDNYGPFDLTLIENGAYGEGWATIHMMPEEVAQAHLDLKGKHLLPIHWAKFNLALHPWKEPIERLTKATKEKNISLLSPIMGESFTLEDSLPQDSWWEEIQ